MRPARPGRTGGARRGPGGAPGIAGRARAGRTPPRIPRHPPDGVSCTERWMYRIPARVAYVGPFGGAAAGHAASSHAPHLVSSVGATRPLVPVVKRCASGVRLEPDSRRTAYVADLKSTRGLAQGSGSSSRRLEFRPRRRPAPRRPSRRVRSLRRARSMPYARFGGSVHESSNGFPHRWPQPRHLSRTTGPRAASGSPSKAFKASARIAPGVWLARDTNRRASRAPTRIAILGVARIGVSDSTDRARESDCHGLRVVGVGPWRPSVGAADRPHRRSMRSMGAQSTAKSG